MKNKASVNSIAFAVTLLFSIAIVTTIFNNNTFSFFNKENNLKARVKIYIFLLADKARYKKYAERNAEQVLKLRNLTAEYTLQLSPDARNLYVKELDLIGKTLIDERLNADTSELPEDFSESWSKFTIAAKSNSEMYRSGAISKLTPESRDTLNKELNTCAEEFRRVVKNYDFELGSELILIDKES
jgi:hypothetical protein